MPRIAIAAARALPAGPSCLGLVRVAAGRAFHRGPVVASAEGQVLPQASAMPPAYAPLASKLGAAQPCFGVSGDSVELLPTPTEFHERLLNLIRGARKRILISTLYIGVEEESLVDAVNTALAANPGLRVTFVLDYNRATRPSRTGPASTVHMLMPLLEKYGASVDIWLYRTPKLSGVLERIVPPRFNEGWGTWHAKYYCVDDDVVLSGANLAQSYFTNRQDRYIQISSHPALLSYLSSLTRLISDYSYKVTAHARPGTLGAHGVTLQPGQSPKVVGKRSALRAGGPGALWRDRSLPPRGWAEHARATLSAFQQAWRASNGVRARDARSNGADTWMWPVLQAGVLGLREEERAMALVFDAIQEAQKESPVNVDLTSGYFGLYKAYKAAVVESSAPVRIIAASPEANGFFGSKGLSRLIPEGYTLLEKRFYADVERAGRTEGVRLQEWKRDGWTYHAKGLWLSQEDPFFTFIGSSNLSTRSLNLDTELSLLMATSNPGLRAAFKEELERLRMHAHDVGPETWATPDRHVSWLSKLLVAVGVEGML